MLSQHLFREGTYLVDLRLQGNAAKSVQFQLCDTIAVSSFKPLQLVQFQLIGFTPFD